MWIRFWHKGRCGSGLSSVESEYVWCDALASDECMLDEAYERAPEWQKQAERGFDYGYEVVEIVPPEVKEDLIKQHEATIKHSKRMLKILGAD